jgi:hypothetical protein
MTEQADFHCRWPLIPTFKFPAIDNTGMEVRPKAPGDRPSNDMRLLYYGNLLVQRQFTARWPGEIVYSVIFKLNTKILYCDRIET